MSNTWRFPRTLAVVIALLVAGCAALSADPVTIRYTLWDANQLPAYQKVADTFMAKNPDIKIVISQLGWGDYWNDLQTSMVAGTASDVFTDHLAKYPEFAAKGQLLDISPMVKAEGVDTSVYLTGLADLWTRDGKRYGLPKDWDTIAVVYNKNMLKDAGITQKDIDSWTWNSKDGGTYQKALAMVTRDKNGNNGLSSKFDTQNVVRWGTAMDYANMGAYGQQMWSCLTASTGWKYNDGMYATQYYYDDPKFIATIQWLADLSRKRALMAPFEAMSNSSSSSLFAAQKIAMLFDGSWMIGTYASITDFPVGFARLPIGPNGRKSMFNGLADSIFVGTQHPKEAWRWVKYLGSADAQNIVGSYGAVFPAIASGVQAAQQTYKGKGVDVSAFTAQALEKNGTFLFPITDNASEINSIMQQTLDSIFLGQATAAVALKDANVKVNATFTK